MFCSLRFRQEGIESRGASYVAYHDLFCFDLSQSSDRESLQEPPANYLLTVPDPLYDTGHDNQKTQRANRQRWNCYKQSKSDTTYIFVVKGYSSEKCKNHEDGARSEEREQPAPPRKAWQNAKEPAL